jgi:hypothetical protein
MMAAGGTTTDPSIDMIDALQMMITDELGVSVSNIKVVQLVAIKRKVV